MGVFIIILGACLIGILVVNLVAKERKKKILLWLLRLFLIFSCIITGFSFKIGFISLEEKDFSILFLVIIMTLCAYFFVSDLIPYLKNKNNLDVAQKAIQTAVATNVGILFCLAYWLYHLLTRG